MKLVLGTVQLGMPYGIDLTQNPSEEEVLELLSMAADCGIECFDTAQVYGKAEDCIGAWARKNPARKNNVRIVSKTPPGILRNTRPGHYYETIKAAMQNSLKRMHIENLNAYLFHDADYVYDEEALQSLAQLKKEGYIERVGVSVYDMQQASKGLASSCVDMLQLPFNAFDHRAKQEGIFSKAAGRKTAIHIRSVFLQGLFFMDPTDIPAHMAHTVPYVRKFRQIAEEAGVGIAELAFGYVKAQENIECLVVGVQSITQLKELIDAYNKEVSKDAILSIDSVFADMDATVYLPTKWKR